MFERGHFVVLIHLETQKKERKLIGACSVALEFHHTLQPKKESLCRSCEAGVTSKQRKANQNTRGTKAGMPRWTDRNHERRDHTHKNLRNDMDGWDQRPSISGRPGPPSWPTTSSGPWPYPTFLRLNLVSGRLQTPYCSNKEMRAEPYVGAA